MAANEEFENSTYLPAGDRSQANCEKSLALGGGLGNCGQRKERWCVSKNELRNVTTGNFEGWDRPVSSCLFSSHFFTCHVRTVYHPGGLVPRCRDALRRRAERVGGRKVVGGKHRDHFDDRGQCRKVVNCSLPCTYATGFAVVLGVMAGRS